MAKGACLEHLQYMLTEWRHAEYCVFGRLTLEGLISALRRFLIALVPQGVRGRLAGAYRSLADSPTPSGVSNATYYRPPPTCQVANLPILLTRFLGDREDGLFVEIGGFDGYFASNTWALAERGWTGWYVEPVPNLAQRCRRNHRNHAGVQVVECAIANGMSETVTLHLAGTLTTANDQLFDEYSGVAWAQGSITSQNLVVPAMSLENFFRDYDVPYDLDLLVVDVEGFEHSVLAKFGEDQYRPKMLIVELADTHPDLLSTASTDAVLMQRILGEGYVVVYKDAINTVFVRADTWQKAYEQIAAASE